MDFDINEFKVAGTLLKNIVIKQIKGGRFVADLKVRVRRSERAKRSFDDFHLTRYIEPNQISSYRKTLTKNARVSATCDIREVFYNGKHGSRKHYAFNIDKLNVLVTRPTEISLD